MEGVGGRGGQLSSDASYAAKVKFRLVLAPVFSVPDCCCPPRVEEDEAVGATGVETVQPVALTVVGYVQGRNLTGIIAYRRFVLHTKQ
jgi:hypothetical protein